MKINKLFLGLAAAAMMLVACNNEELILGDSTTPQIDSANPDVAFAASNATKLELDPSSPEFTVTLTRNAKDAATYNLVAVENEDNSFEVPATVSFAADETSKDITVKIKDTAKQGTPITLKLGLDEDKVNPYSQGLKTLTVAATIIKWESIGKGVWEGNIINTFFGVQAQPLLVEIEKATTATATKFRFVSPYCKASEEQDEESGAFLGYPYNAEADLDGNVEKFVITVTKDGASLAPAMMGMDWGYGSFAMGSVYGYVSNNIATYPLGVYSPSETGGTIVFQEKSLYISMADYDDGGKYPCSKGPTTLYLSIADYLAATEE